MLPSTAMLPLAGESSPVSRRSSVDLPTPLRPTRPVRSHWKWRSRLERTARPSGVDQPRLAMAIDGEEAGMNMDFPGGKAGRRCGQIIVHDGEAPVRLRGQCRGVGDVVQIFRLGASMDPGSSPG